MIDHKLPASVSHSRQSTRRSELLAGVVRLQACCKPQDRGGKSETALTHGQVDRRQRGSTDRCRLDGTPELRDDLLDRPPVRRRSVRGTPWRPIPRPAGARSTAATIRRSQLQVLRRQLRRAAGRSILRDHRHAARAVRAHRLDDAGHVLEPYRARDELPRIDLLRLDHRQHRREIRLGRSTAWRSSPSTCGTSTVPSRSGRSRLASASGPDVGALSARVALRRGGLAKDRADNEDLRLCPDRRVYQPAVVPQRRRRGAGRLQHGPEGTASRKSLSISRWYRLHACWSPT